MMQRIPSMRGLVWRMPWVAAAAIVALAAVALTTGSAQAHAAYVSSDPAANSVLKADPSKVTIHFAQNLSPQGLTITVYDNKGAVVSTGVAQISAADPKTASVTMKGDGSDIYRVDWTTVSAEDSDPTLGAFVFAVDPSGKSDKVASTATAASTGHTTSTASAGVSVLAAVLIGIAGLVIGAGGTYVATRPRTPSQTQNR